MSIDRRSNTSLLANTHMQSQGQHTFYTNMYHAAEILPPGDPF